MSSVITAPKNFIDITSQVTVNSTYCENVKVMTDGQAVFARGRAKTGTPDQTNLISVPSSLGSQAYIAGNVFYLNGVDIGKDATVSIYGSNIQMRLNGTIQGASGICFLCSWIVGL